MNIKRPTDFLSVVIPAYNESQRISPTLFRIEAHCREYFMRHEIIVVNDGSSDNTEAIISGLREQIPAVRLTGSGVNRGKGYAIRQGIAISQGDVILVSDADLSTPIEEVQKLLSYYHQGFDIVIGSRGLSDSAIVVRQPWWREYMGKAFNMMIRALHMTEFRDTQCGFKLFDGAVGRKIFAYSTIDRFAYDVEILYLAAKAGYRIKEVPIRWLNSPASKVRTIHDSFLMARDLMRIRLMAGSLSRKITGP